MCERRQRPCQRSDDVRVSFDKASSGVYYYLFDDRGTVCGLCPQGAPSPLISDNPTGTKKLSQTHTCARTRIDIYRGWTSVYTETLKIRPVIAERKTENTEELDHYRLLFHFLSFSWWVRASFISSIDSERKKVLFQTRWQHRCEYIHWINICRAD